MATIAPPAPAVPRGIEGPGFGHTGDEEYNTFLSVIFPDDQLRILPYNRVVKDFNGFSKEEFMARVRRSFAVLDDGPPAPSQPRQWSMYLEGRWYGLSLPPEATKPEGIVASLDVSLLQDRLLDPILGIKDIRTDKRIDFVGGARGTAELERLVNGGKAAVAFSLFPTSMKDLLTVSDARTQPARVDLVRAEIT
jgi:uncharacterized protein (DUF1015 family)